MSLCPLTLQAVRPNVGEFLGEADGFIVGSEFKAGGHWSGAVEPKRVRRFMAAVT